MNPNYTDITIVLDRSGSMNNVTADTIGGYNKFLADQRKASGFAKLSLFTFNDVVEPIVVGENIAVTQPLTEENYRPLGNTALLDAIGFAMDMTGRRLAAMGEDNRPTKVVFVIVTDGEENSSKSYNRKQVLEKIKHQKERYNWEFVFLGANQDAIREGESYGLNASNCMTYAHNAAGTKAAFESLSANTVSYRDNVVRSMSFTHNDAAEQLKAGVTQ